MTNRAMKDSGVEWIGEIPDKWIVGKVRNAFYRKKEKANDVNPTILSLARSGIKVRDISNNEGQLAADYSNYNPVSVGDVLLNPMDLVSGANCNISNIEGVISPAYINLRAKTDYSGKYYNYYFKLQYWSYAFFAHGKGVSYENRWTLNNETIMKYPITVPSYEEQQKIAAFLDEKVAHIDNIIEDTKKSIENLKAYKQSLITETVTKGLNPDVEMKDSGIDWIGDIPKYWKIYKIRQIFKEHKEKNEGLIEDNLLSLSYGKVKRRDIKSKEGLLPQSFEGYNIIKPGDIVLRMTDLQNDQKSLRVGLCKEKGIITSAYISIRAYNNIYPHYAYYYLHSFDIYKGFYGMGAGVRQGVNFNELKKLDILFPTYDEQKQIAIFLDEKSKAIDSTIEQKEQLITELEAYKKSLIYEYVTGKKEVK